MRSTPALSEVRQSNSYYPQPSKWTEPRLHCSRKTALGLCWPWSSRHQHCSSARAEAARATQEHSAAPTVQPHRWWFFLMRTNRAPFLFICRLYCFFWSPGNNQELVCMKTAMKTLHWECCYLNSLEIRKCSQKASTFCYWEHCPARGWCLPPPPPRSG